MSYKAFMPNSMTGHAVTEGKKAKMVIKEIKDGKVKKIIVSSKEVEAKINSEKLQSFNVGDVVEGTVKEVLEFGLTLNINEINVFARGLTILSSSSKIRIARCSILNTRCSLYVSTLINR